MKHVIEYAIVGAATGLTTYMATCSCGEQRESVSPTFISTWGPLHEVNA